MTNWTSPRQALPTPYHEVEAVCMDGATKYVYASEDGGWFISIGDPSCQWVPEAVEVDVWREREW